MAQGFPSVTVMGNAKNKFFPEKNESFITCQGIKKRSLINKMFYLCLLSFGLILFINSLLGFLFCLLF